MKKSLLLGLALLLPINIYSEDSFGKFLFYGLSGAALSLLVVSIPLIKIQVEANTEQEIERTKQLEIQKEIKAIELQIINGQIALKKCPHNNLTL